ncbi:hypothetical protein FALBO_4135 [Fusarium albosuccineum]|uniref:Uncharacterized protein n=1 Tax=Fusarium albosuccineum TaxID=1237068 RepID=A0A8H4LJE3_9HYPO|nr:hypothetical protein FALBO_4135 [Fusarium albosuccineum]
MCHFLELEFSCSDGGRPHRIRTDALCKCDNPFGCIAEEMWSEADADEDMNDWAQEDFKVLYVGGNCEKCTNKKDDQLAEQEKFLVRYHTDVEEMGHDLERIESDREKQQVKNASQNAFAQRDFVDFKTPCASGPCKYPVVISRDGRKGHFCQKHTCAAQYWGCLADSTPNSESPAESIYCPVHTCSKRGCGMRIDDENSIFCCLHRRRGILKTPTLSFPE